MQECNTAAGQEYNTAVGLSADTGSTRSLTDSSDSSKSIEALHEIRPTNVPPLWDPNDIEACPRIICHTHQPAGEEISLWDPMDLTEFVRAAKMIVSVTSELGSSPVAAGPPSSPSSSVGTTEVSAPIQKTCFQSMSECCSRWYVKLS